MVANWYNNTMPTIYVSIVWVYIAALTFYHAYYWWIITGLAVSPFTLSEVHAHILVLYYNDAQWNYNINIFFHL